MRRRNIYSRRVRLSLHDIWRKYCPILGSLREKLEFKHADEAALSALFEEFGSSKFVNFESGRSGGPALSVVSTSLSTVLTIIVWLLR